MGDLCSREIGAMDHGWMIRMIYCVEINTQRGMKVKYTRVRKT